MGPNQAAPATVYSGGGTPATQGVSFLNRSFLLSCRFWALASKAQGTIQVEEIKPIKCSPRCGPLGVLSSCPQSMMLTHTNTGRPDFCELEILGFCEPLCMSLNNIVRLSGWWRGHPKCEMLQGVCVPNTGWAEAARAPGDMGQWLLISSFYIFFLL